MKTEAFIILRDENGLPKDIYDRKTGQSNIQTYKYQYTQNEELIINDQDPIFFQSEKYDEIIEEVTEKIKQRFPVYNSIAKKYPFMYKSQTQSYTSTLQDSYITISEDVILKELSNLMGYNGFLYHSRKDENIKEFAKFLEDTGAFEVDTAHSYQGQVLNRKDFKKSCNKAGIYVQPVKGILSYDPAKAAKQLKRLLLSESSKKNYRKKNVSRKDIRDVIDQISHSIGHWANRGPFPGDLYSVYPTGNYKGTTSNKMVFYIDLMEICCGKYSYRRLKSFQTIKENWKNVTKEERKEVSGKFCRMMDEEIKVKKKYRTKEPKDFNSMQKNNPFKRFYVFEKEVEEQNRTK